MRWTAGAALVVCLASQLALPTAAEAAPTKCEPERGNLPKSEITLAPWPQQAMPLDKVHEHATGRGVRVAVIDSGGDNNNPQLKFEPTIDLTRTGKRDCVGHGTEVAAIIGAKKGHSLFHGVAPDATIIPIKYAAAATQNDPALLVKGIYEAIKARADIINISSETHAASPQLRAAVLQATAKGILIVASAGNIDPERKGTPTPAFPAQYEEVLSVGSFGQDGQVSQFSNARTRVSVIAPGKDIVTIAPDGGYISKEGGTSFAAPFVAGVAALVKQQHPELNGQQIMTRIERTAQGSKGDGSGSGQVSPLEAVTSVIDVNAVGAPRAEPGSLTLPRRDTVDATTRAVALGIGGGALGLAALVVAAGMVIPAGRRRGWKPGQVTFSDDDTVTPTRRVR
ncbi:S8 family serine peptidase [Spirillospora sp. NPDC047279]|uniref:S8 family peptidase n=1 Tax=Spirillospora sp. NPDC047279 TaxID=3155478 RepID=UPI0033D1DDE0